MDSPRLHGVVVDAVGDRRLLDHPFYLRWEAGELAPAELARYAEQYRHLESALPSVLAAVVEQLGEGRAAELVAENLADELGMPLPHLEMFERFAEAVGARPAAAAGPATSALVGLQRGAVRRSAAEGIAVLAAYECQAGDIAVSKADGLRRHYGVDALGTWFWDVHGALEARHADWSVEALSLLGMAEADVASSVADAARAWWGYLDEREAEAAAA